MKVIKMKKGHLSLMVATSIMLVTILISVINKAATSEGMPVYILSLAALMITFMSTKIYKKENICLTGKNIAIETLGLLALSIISIMFAPHLVTLLITSLSLGINIRYLMYSLKNVVHGNEGV